MLQSPDVAFKFTHRRKPTPAMMSRHTQLGKMKVALRRLLMGAGRYAPVSDSQYGAIKKHMERTGPLRRPAPTGSKRKPRTIKKGTKKQRDAAAQIQPFLRGFINRQRAAKRRAEQAAAMPVAMPAPVLVLGTKTRPYPSVKNALTALELTTAAGLSDPPYVINAQTRKPRLLRTTTGKKRVNTLK